MLSKTTGHPHISFIKEYDYPFDMDSQTNLFRYLNQSEHSSTSSSSVSPLIDGAKIWQECQKLYDNFIPIKEISRRLNISEYKIEKNIILKILSKKCKYCDITFTNKDYPYIFDKKITCGSKKCFSKLRVDYAREHLKEYNKNYIKTYQLRYIYKIKRKVYSKKYRDTHKEVIRKRNKPFNDEMHKNYRIMENQRRVELGLPLIGQNYKKEIELLKYVNQIFPNNNVIHNKKIISTDINSKHNLQLDIYIPSKRLAFEYMGEQHYNPNIYYYLTKNNGSFEALNYRDKIKKRICKFNNISLIRVKYNEKLSKDLVIFKLKRASFNA